MKWQLLSTISAPMPFQMALDEILFEKQKQKKLDPVLRFYVSSEPWLSVGYSFRDAAGLSKCDLIHANPLVPICRRLTGGGCVLHGKDLMFSLVAKAEWDSIHLGSVQTSYGKIHESVRIAFETCGLNLEFYKASDELPRGNDCFHFPVASDLAWKGQKIAGGAQKRSQGVLLHQESLQVPSGVVLEELIGGIQKGFETVFNITFTNEPWDPELFFISEKGQKTL